MNNLKYYINHLKYVVNTDKFVITFILILLLNIYGIFNLDEYEGLFEGLYAINTNTFINIFVILFCALNSFTIYDYLSNDSSYMIRCNDKNNYNKIIIKNIIFINAFIIILSTLIGLIGLLIKYNLNFEIGKYYFYNISNIIYFIFFVFRKFVFINLLVIILIYIKKLFGNIIMYISLFAIIARIITYFYQATAISSFLDIKFFIGYYFGLYQYSSFSLEIACSLFIGILLTITSFFLHKLTIKFKL